MSNRRRTSQVQPSLVENIRYPLPLKLTIKNVKCRHKIKKILFFGLIFMFILFKGLGIWTNN